MKTRHNRRNPVQVVQVIKQEDGYDDEPQSWQEVAGEIVAGLLLVATLALWGYGLFVGFRFINTGNDVIDDMLLNQSVQMETVQLLDQYNHEIAERLYGPQGSIEVTIEVLPPEGYEQYFEPEMELLQPETEEPEFY